MLKNSALQKLCFLTSLLSSPKNLQTPYKPALTQQRKREILINHYLISLEERGRRKKEEGRERVSSILESLTQPNCLTTSSYSIYTDLKVTERMKFHSS